ncbi:hypothetical protein NW762_006385 [Fusarium torreyae]|uniref:Uncharacterized protein n=1 Tax=Fusarium torreyae TaxID=1237075 RepID=A0A9W8S3C8_9HYPO|nr:hypothetical protein NW762_006385 [Fusarium torreyae]
MNTMNDKMWPKALAWPPTGKKIDWVGFFEPVHDGERVFLEVPLRGRLDWSFAGPVSSVVHHENRESQDEMQMVMAKEAASGKACPDPVVDTFVEEIGYFWG